MPVTNGTGSPVLTDDVTTDRSNSVQCYKPAPFQPNANLCNKICIWLNSCAEKVGKGKRTTGCLKLSDIHL